MEDDIVVKWNFDEHEITFKKNGTGNISVFLNDEEIGELDEIQLMLFYKYIIGNKIVQNQ